MTKKLYLIDGSGFIFRAYHALPPLTRPDGTPAGAVYGFTTMLLKLIEGHDADYLAVIFDAGRKTFRNRIYPEYKANRPPAPDDLVPQFPLVREATEAMSLPAIELADYEADDIIATYARIAREQGIEVVIVSSDKDLMQLIGDGVSMYDAMKQRNIGPAQVMEKFGVGPEKVLDVLSLIGDSSDNVPGVPGIGPKTAAELVIQFGGLDEVLARAGEIKQNKRRETIQQNVEQAKLSRELIKLHYEVPLPPLEELKIKEFDKSRLLEFMQKMGFKSLVTKFGGTPQLSSPPSALRAPSPLEGEGRLSAPPPRGGRGGERTPISEYVLVQDLATLEKWIAEARSNGTVAFDTETTSLDAMQAEVVGFSLCITPGRACYVPLGHKKEGAEDLALGIGGGKGVVDLFSNPQCPMPSPLLEGQIPIKDALAALKLLLEDPSVMKIGQNIKYDMLVLRKYGLNIAPIADTMLMSFVLDAGRFAHNMDDLAGRELNTKTITFEEVCGKGKSRIGFAEVPLDKALAYAAEDADITLQLHDTLSRRMISEHLVTIYETEERALVPVLVAMEARGILVDKPFLSELSVEFAGKLAVLEKQVQQMAGIEFNVGSPKQLGEVLFDKLQLPGGKKSAKTGAYATGADVLEELAEQGHEIAKRMLDWRQLSKLKSTYTDALVTQINPKTGRVHTNYAMAIAQTGRLSSTDPNLQNIPIRTEEGRRLRQAFIAAPEKKLISADYSQIELRLLAHVAGIDVLKEAFKNDEDIHAATARQMFGESNPELRRRAKTINFGIIYGISAFGLSAQLGIPRGEAAQYIDLYFRQYPGIREYMEKMKALAHAQGYVTTPFGRRCHFPEINGKGAMRAFSERAAINAPLQGGAADIIKLAMVDVERELPGKMLLQVHDELILECPEAEAQQVAEQLKSIMEKSVSISVPLKVDVGIGAHWGEVH